MSDVEIRRARREDLGPLVRSLGQEAYFADRLGRQDDDLGILLTAWAKELAIGDAYLWREIAEEPEIRAHLPRVPLLTHLEVADGYRTRGVGTMLVDAVEDEARERGHDRIALAVRLDAPRVCALYHRLGYTDWGRTPVRCMARQVLPCGTLILRPERCRVLVKPLV
jgi:GNAT superfamily N-acetyltransferase